MIKNPWKTSWLFKNLSASAQISDGPGVLHGILVNSSTGGTIKFWDNAAATGAVLANTITPIAGQFIYCGNARFGNALYLTLANTIDVTVFYDRDKE